MQFQHLVVDGPTFFKEQIAHLEIAVYQNGLPKPVPGRLGKLSEKTIRIMECLQDAETPLYSEEVAERTGLSVEYCRSQMSHYLKKADTYGIKAVTLKKRRAYTSV